MTYASGTWTLSQKHEKMIKTSQRKMLRPVVQTKKKYKPKSKKEVVNVAAEEIKKYEEDGKVRNWKRNRRGFRSELGQRSRQWCVFPRRQRRSNWHYRERGRIEYIRRSTKEAEEHMKEMKILCRIETHRRLKWGMARRIVSLPESGPKKFATDNLDLTTKSKLEDRWEDPNEDGRTTSTSPQKPDETKGKEKYDLTNNNCWMTEAKKKEEWRKKEDSFLKCGDPGRKWLIFLNANLWSQFWRDDFLKRVTRIRATSTFKNLRIQTLLFLTVRVTTCRLTDIDRATCKICRIPPV